MTLESVGIPTLLFAHLAVKLELLQPLGLDAIANVLGASAFGFGHGAKMGERGGGAKTEEAGQQQQRRQRANECLYSSEEKKGEEVWRLAFGVLLVGR